MSLQDKFAGLKFNKVKVTTEKVAAETIATAAIVSPSEEWSALLRQVKNVPPEIRDFIYCLSEQGANLSDDRGLGKTIVLDSEVVSLLPAITIEINTEKSYPHGSLLL